MKNNFVKKTAHSFSSIFCTTTLCLGIIFVSTPSFADIPTTPKNNTDVVKQSFLPDASNFKPTKDQIISGLNILEILRRHHYLKLPIDEQRSAIVYDSFLKSLDPSHSFFLQSDIDSFQLFKPQLFNFLTYGQLTPGFIIYQCYIQRAQERLKYILTLLNKGIDQLDLTTNDKLLIDREKAPWPKNLAEQNKLWTNRLKDDVIRLKLTGKSEDAIKEQLTKRYTNQLKRLKQIKNEDIFQLYINAFALSYDPHTEYMSPDTAENFDISMSLSLDGIGAVLQSDNDYVKVVRLVPAGPAAKSHQLAPADRIIGVAQENKEMVDIIGWRLEDVVKKIRGPKGSKVILEVIPATNPPGDLTTKKITIVRDAVKLEDQAAKKYVLTLKDQGNTHKIGIIELPAFYLDFKAVQQNNSNYKSSTRDVAKLINELQKDKVEGIIIDLRNNGGGSLQEATSLIGLFVHLGPAVQVRDSTGNVATLDDQIPALATNTKNLNKLPLYKGPLIILTNRLSASASEIFAGAMQDYHRALIVGGQTFGKGTVQSVVPLKHGEFKLTVAKFYRVSGQSTQNKGVVPDIAFPAIVDTAQIGENILPQAMPWDTIASVIKPTVDKDPFSPYLKQLKTLHHERAQKDPDFIFLNERMALMDKLGKEKWLSLNETKRKEQKEETEHSLLGLENDKRTAKGEKTLTKLDDSSDESTPPDQEETFNPEKDAYLIEASHIMLDYISLKKADKN